MLLIEECSNSKAVTILVRGGSQTIIDEAMRCIHDSICVVRNMIKNNKIVPGGGASELACSIAVHDYANKIQSIEQYAVRAYGDALEEIPMALAENSGYNQIEYVQALKREQVENKNPYVGVDAMRDGITNMMDAGIFESLLSKKSQLQLATQVVKMILKIDDCIEAAAYE